MSDQRRQSLGEFSNLRQMLRTLAKQELERNQPEYVERFREVLEESGDFNKATDQARPLIGKGVPQWSTLLTLALDVELSLDKLRRALELLGTPVPQLRSEWNAGAWAEYHFDHWVYQSHAWLERLDKLVKRVCRSLIKPHSRQWQQVERRLTGEIAQMANGIGKIRHPLAHGGGGGVTGPQEEGLWEPSLLIDGDVDIVSAAYQSKGQFQEKWHKMLVGVTVKAITRSEAIFRELNRHIVSFGGEGSK
ncbi:MAG: hypothetical protein HYX97_00070 [Chloroflexi bacterium]|nr:hypothetical protein [Chloroflexota bacterium]